MSNATFGISNVRQCGNIITAHANRWLVDPTTHIYCGDISVQGANHIVINDYRVDGI